MKTEQELFVKKYREVFNVDKSLFVNDDGEFTDSFCQSVYEMWQASASREGYKLVPVNTLDECLSWASIAMWDSPSEERDIEITYHVEIIEAMIGASE